MATPMITHPASAPSLGVCKTGNGEVHGDRTGLRLCDLGPRLSWLLLHGGGSFSPCCTSAAAVNARGRRVRAATDHTSRPRSRGYMRLLDAI